MLVSVVAFAQHETDFWYFGMGAGIQFGPGGTNTVINNGQLNNIEGTASMSDSLGNLLFYTDGQTIWNNQHQAMPNGTGLLGGIASQTAVIVPLPGSSDVYYVFTNDIVNGQNGLNYSVVDMSLDAGRGDVTILNGSIQDGLTERLTSTINQAGDAYWITVHEYSTDTFYNYRVNSNGLDSIFVISATGLVNNTSNPGNAYGQMKYSPCGDKLAVATGYLDTVEVFDFDDATGIISNPVSIPMPDHVFGVEFSPDGQKLYVSTYALSTLYQFDLSSGIPSTIIASSTALSITSDTYGLQLASDGKIYVAKNQSKWLGAITDPDIAGPSCHYVDTAINLDPNNTGVVSGLCLPNFAGSFFRSPLCFNTSIDENTEDAEIIYPNPSTENFNLKIKSFSNIYVYDSAFRLLEKYDGTEFTFGSALMPGIYFIFVVTNNHQRVLKVIKQ